MNSVIVKAAKTDKKSIMRFYKTQYYPASYIGQDHCYLVKKENKIIASVVISAGQKNTGYWLLHGLVIDKAHRGKGIASSLLQTAFSEKNNLGQQQFTKIICFAELTLKPFYLANHFINHNESRDIAQLPIEFRQRLKRYQEKQNAGTQNLKIKFIR